MKVAAANAIALLARGMCQMKKFQPMGVKDQNKEKSI